MRQILSSLTWGFLILFAAPTIMIVASWNSLPGDSLYGVKLGLEQALFVLVSPSYAAQGDLSVKYTERRFSEAKRLLSDKGSVEGLQYLDKQVTTTRDIIEKGSDAKTQAALAQKYIDTLTDLSAELSAQQQALASTPQPAARGSTVPTTTSPSQPGAQQVGAPPAAPAVQPGIPVTQPFITQPAAQVQQPPVAGSPQAPSAPAAQAPVAQQQQQAPPPPPVAPASPPPPAQVIAMQQQQINQTQANIQQTIKELEQVTQKAQQENKKSDERRDDHKDQPSQGQQGGGGGGQGGQGGGGGGGGRSDKGND